MTTKRRQRVALPAGQGQWEVKCGTTEAGRGWDDLCQQAPGNTRWAWEQMSNSPNPDPPTPRHHRLRGRYEVGLHEGRRLPLWQIEVTGGGRVWYLVDVEYRTAWIVHAGTGRPKVTE